MKEAHTLMKDSHDMNKIIGKERKRIQDAKSMLEEALLHSTCQTAAKKMRMSSSKPRVVDINNNSDTSD